MRYSLGIDVGNSTVVAAVADNSGVETVKLGLRTPAIPSIAHVTAGGSVRHQEWVAADQLADRPAVGDRHQRGTLPGCGAPGRRREERQAGGFGELRPGLLPRQADQDARLGRPRHELHAAAGEQRCVAEDSAGLDGVDRRAVGDLQRHMAGANHPHVVRHLRGVVRDHRIGGEPHDRRPGGKLVQLVRRHPLERGVLTEEPAQVPRIRSAHFSAMVITVMLGFTAGSFGIADASTTRNRDTPLTRSCGSSTAMGSVTEPIRAVAAG